MKIKDYILILVLVQFGCSNSDKDLEQIKFKNNIGFLKINTLDYFDMSYQTLKLSDCGCCCNEYWYSYVDSNFDNYPYKDTLYFFVGYNPDSLVRHSLTISHPVCTDCFGTEPLPLDEEMLKEHYRNRMNLYVSEHYDKDFLDSSIVKVNGRNYSILSYRSAWNNNNILEVLDAYTIVNNQPVNFGFKKIGSDTTDFITTAKSILNSVEIIDN